MKPPYKEIYSRPLDFFEPDDLPSDYQNSNTGEKGVLKPYIPQKMALADLDYLLRFWGGRGGFGFKAQLDRKGNLRTALPEHECHYSPTFSLPNAPTTVGQIR